MKTNYKFGEVTKQNSVIDYSDNSVVFKQVFETNNGGVALLALKAGQKLETHTTPFEVMLNVSEGEIEFKMLDDEKNIKEGEFLLMGANVPHSVVARKDSKILLIKIKD